MIFLSTEVEYTYLEHLPTSFFKRLIDNWEKTSVELHPNGLLSKENRETTIKLVKNLTAAKQKTIQKLAEILNISGLWWDVYHIPKIKPLSHLQNHKKAFDVDKYSEEASAKISGKFSINELSEHAIFIHIEFSSRTARLRRTFRFIYLPSVKKILLEPQKLGLEILKNEILPFISNEPNKVSKKPIRALLIKKLTKDYDDPERSFILSHLKIKVSLETSGIEGLNQIVIQGDNVLRGAETLEQRHEISLKFMNSGPWIGAGTEDFTLEVGRGLQIHRMEETSLKSIASMLSLL